MTDIAGRQRQFEQCVDQHHEGLYRVALRLTGREAVASELVQETYLQAWRGLPSLRDVERMRAWLYAILRRQFLKSLGRSPEWLATDFHSTTENDDGEQSTGTSWLDQHAAVPDQAPQTAQRDMIQWALQRLDVRYRFPVLLQLVEEMSVDEIGQALELPQGTVLSHLHRGKQQLRAILEREMASGQS
ncbi:MAG: RNA polymerase sigma factor [Pirellulaceae bacterium]|nr:RNA polymerase sigma factor [Pirellulaceae bacterium]